MSALLVWSKMTAPQSHRHPPNTARCSKIQATCP